MPEKTFENSEIQVKGLEARLAFEQSMRALINKVHSASLEEILLYLRDEIEKLVTCRRVTLYAHDSEKSEIYSKVKDGEEIKEIRLPISSSSIAGYVAITGKTIRIQDVYDTAELKRISPDLRFDPSWDKQSGFRTRQILAVPILASGRLYGVIQGVNTTHGKPFVESEAAIFEEFSRTLGIAFHNQAKLSIRSSRYDYLLRNERLTSSQIDQAQALAKEQKSSVDQILVTHFKISKEELTRSLCEFFKCEYVAFRDTISISTNLLEGFTIDYLKYNIAVPLGLEGGKLIVAMENPRNVLFLDSIQQISGKEIVPKVSTREEIFQFIDHLYGKGGRPSSALGLASTLKDLGKKTDLQKGKSAPAATEAGSAQEAQEDDSGVVRLVNQIIEQAHEKGASDIHIEPHPDGDTLVRIRVDGNCHETARVPGAFARAMVARIKIMSDLDITVRRLPQDGKIRFRDYGASDIELRVATLPTSGDQEDVVLRILPPSQPVPLDQIGMGADLLTRFKRAVSAPCGIILCVGPTGSGKTTTLHAALGHLNQPDTKIWTAEDPVEVTQKGLRQIQVHSKIGLTFARCLRSFLRADPDIIMIGEMRDIETAEAAIEAALTGHLVFSTLHTNSAADTVARLTVMGVDPFALGDSLIGVLSQRLIRRLCTDCVESYTPTAAEWTLLSEAYGVEAFASLNLKRTDIKLARSKGCERCHQTGYRGRLGIHEFLEIDDDIRPLIYRKAPSSEIRAISIQKGMTLLNQDGLAKVLQGLTDLKEVRSTCMK